MGEFLRTVWGGIVEQETTNPVGGGAYLTSIKSGEPDTFRVDDLPALNKPLIPLLADLRSLYSGGTIINTDYAVQQVKELGIDVYDDMLAKDAHLFSCAETLIGGAASLPYRIVAADSTNASYQEHADFIRGVFDSFDFIELKKDLAHSRLKGFSVIQPLHDKILWKGKQKIGINGHIRIPERMFTIGLDRRIRVITRNNPVEGTPLPSRGFFLVDFRGSQPYGDALLTHAYAAFWFKRAITRLALKFMERWGDPPLIGYYGNPNQRKEIVEALEQIKGEMVAAMPTPRKDEPMPITVLQPGRDVAFQPLMEYFDDQMSKVFTSGTLSMGHAGGRGNLAATIEHEDRFDGRIIEVAKSQEYVINRQLIKPLIDLNFGPQDAYPYYAIGDEEASDPTAFSAVVGSLWTNGVQLPLSKKELYAGLQLTPPTDAEDTIIPPSKDPAAAGGMGGINFPMPSASRSSLMAMAETEATLTRLRTSQQTKTRALISS